MWRRQVNPYRLYLVGLAFGDAFLVSIVTTTSIVYWVTTGHLNPLQLLLLGTAIEITYFVFQLPTGVLADRVSRRGCIVAGWIITGIGFGMQGFSAAYPNLLLAQVVVGLGAALGYGATEAWIADELDDAEMTSVYLRGAQLEIVGVIGGSLLSGLIALGGLYLPFLIGGGAITLAGVGLAFVMPERNFRGADSVPVGGVLKDGWSAFVEQIGTARRTLVIVPGLALLFGMTFFVGMWSESFDRLWGAFLLHDFRFPSVGGLRAPLWFSFIACAVALISLGSTEIAKRRTERLGHASVVGTLIAVTALMGIGAVLMAVSHVFALAVAAYLLVQAVRPVISPLVTGWMIGRIEPGVRATALSAKDMFDSGGQFIGGPVIGVIGNVASIRTALLAGSAALAPAVALLAAATRKLRVRPELQVEVTLDEPAPLLPVDGHFHNT